MSSVLEANVKLINDKIKFEATAGDNAPFITDYIPPFGDLEGYMPLEIFLLSLSACLGGSIAILLRKQRFAVDGLTIKAVGNRREEHPTYFDKINLIINLKSSNATLEDLDKVVKLSEDKMCPVIAMLNENVMLSYEYIVE